MQRYLKIHRCTLRSLHVLLCVSVQRASLHSKTNMEPKLKVKTKAEVLIEARKKGPSSTRASKRARTMALVKEVTDLLAMLGPHKKAAVKVLADQLKALKPLKNPQGQITEWVPDEIIRQKAAIAILEWLEGKPRELQIQVTGKPEDFSDMLQRYQQSPAFQKIVATDESLQKTILGKEITPALEDSPGEQQAPGTENS